MQNLDYCPFCGCDDVTLITMKHHFGWKHQICCNHCSAQGGAFVVEEKDDIESVVEDWNQKDLRPKTLCDRIRRAFTQVEYDLTTLWGRF